MSLVALDILNTDNSSTSTLSSGIGEEDGVNEIPPLPTGPKEKSSATKQGVVDRQPKAKQEDTPLGVTVTRLKQEVALLREKLRMNGIHDGQDAEDALEKLLLEKRARDLRDRQLVSIGFLEKQEIKKRRSNMMLILSLWVDLIMSLVAIYLGTTTHQATVFLLLITASTGWQLLTTNAERLLCFPAAFSVCNLIWIASLLLCSKIHFVPFILFGLKMAVGMLAPWTIYEYSIDDRRTVRELYERLASQNVDDRSNSKGDWHLLRFSDSLSQSIKQHRRNLFALLRPAVHYILLKFRRQIKPITVYTDAACSTQQTPDGKKPVDATGLGVFIADDHPLNTGFRLKEPVDNINGELQAVELAIDRLHGWAWYWGEEVKIVTDCAAIVDGLNRKIKDDGRYQRLRQIIKSTFLSTVTFEKVRSRTGVYGNEKVDGLAKECIGMRWTSDYNELATNKKEEKGTKQQETLKTDAKGGDKLPMTAKIEVDMKHKRLTNSFAVMSAMFVILCVYPVLLTLNALN